jgi:hypothetical protein
MSRTAAQAVEYFAEHGFAGAFEHEQDQVSLRCRECGATGPVEQFDVRDREGVGGAHDPHVVVALICFNCGAGGTIVLSSGESASEADASVLAAILRGGPSGQTHDR